jgi:hypothetical protein
MGSFAPDNCSEANDGIEIAGLAEEFCYLGKFERPRAREHLYVLPEHSVLVEALERAPTQLVRD